MLNFSAIAVLVHPSRLRRRTSAQSCTSYTLPPRVDLTRGSVANCQRWWTAQFSTGVTRAVLGRRRQFMYFPDELHFSRADLVGLSVEEARALRHQRDVGW